MSGRGGGDRGTMAVEFVIAAPAFIVLLLLIALGGEWVTASGSVGSAARDAVRQATVEVRYADVGPAAAAVSQADLKSLCPGAANVTVVRLLDGGGQVVGPAAWTAGAQVAQVKVSCTVSLRVFALLRIPASQTFTDTAAAPLDPFTERTG